MRRFAANNVTILITIEVFQLKFPSDRLTLSVITIAFPTVVEFST